MSDWTGSDFIANDVPIRAGKFPSKPLQNNDESSFTVVESMTCDALVHPMLDGLTVPLVVPFGQNLYGQLGVSAKHKLVFRTKMAVTSTNLCSVAMVSPTN